MYAKNILFRVLRILKTVTTSLLLFILIITNSCGKDQPTEITMAGQWKLAEWYDNSPLDINKDGTASTDLLSQWNGCNKTSTLELLSDGTSKIIYTGEPNNPRCPPGVVKGSNFTGLPWTTDNKYTTLTFNGDDFIDLYEVVELTNTTLTLRGAGFITCCDESISYYTDGYLKFIR